MIAQAAELEALAELEREVDRLRALLEAREPAEAVRELLVVVPGKPQPLGRPRFSSRGSRWARTPESSARMLLRIASCATIAATPAGWKARGDRAFEVWVEVSPIANKGGREPAPGNRGDVDNHLKMALDGLTGVAWVDDKQVVEAHVKLLPASAEGLMRIRIRDVGRLP